MSACRTIFRTLLILGCLLLLEQADIFAARPAAPPFTLAASEESARPAKMDSAIARLARLGANPLAEEEARALGLPLERGRVQVNLSIAGGAVEAVVRAVVAAGGIVTGQIEGGRRLQAWLPIEALTPLATRNDILMIRRPSFAEPLAGPITSEGTMVSGASVWHAAGWIGQGVRIGIIDVGFEGYTALLGSELPASVVAKNFVDGQTDAQVDGTTPHGTACAEIVHDMAPGAALYLAKIATDVDLAEAVAWLKDAQHVQIISTSLGFFNLSPGDGTGPLADLAQSVEQAGILWVTAAGNYRQSHWGGPWLDADGDGKLEFGPSLETNRIKINGSFSLPPYITIRAYLRWSDWSAVNQDYDLFLMRWTGSAWEAIASSTNPQTGAPGQMPTEALQGTTYGVPTEYAIVIQRYNASRAVHFELFVPDADELQAPVYARSLVTPADAQSILAVGAVKSRDPYGQEPYSSEGPTNGPGGVASGGFPKPDLAAYDAVSTSSWGEFAGTSASTPHVAGAAALVWGAFPDYSAAQVRSFLEGRAIDMGSLGRDTQYGYGRLSLGATPLVDIKMRLWLPLLRR